MKRWDLTLLIILILEICIFAYANPKFLMPRVIFGSINDIIPICIISLFVTMVMITAGIDIQAGAVVGLSSIIVGVTWQDLGLNIWIASLVAIVIAALVGLITGYIVAYYQVQPMVVTLGGSFLYAGLALLISTLSSTESYKGISGFPESFVNFASYRIGGVLPVQVVVFLVMAAFAWFLLHKTKYGRKIFLIGINQNAAEYSGINTRFIIMTTYVLSGIAAAVSGILLTSYLGTAKSDLGATITLPIITAVVLGGTLMTGGKGSIIGTALAAVIIGVLKFGLPLCFRVNMQYLDIPVGLLLLIVISARALSNRPEVIVFISNLKKNRSKT
ncbi:ABC transporter permease [Succinivibrio dextrinosolvens]|uniref:Autoinducer 2 import system permease protein LsrD n=1 Tax=Succinivibrio dextrinosolvens TaxID=83771 RepID=A0A662ZBD5_9GAMM|nr:ABC transporter permease [Succinivibrio dextrinosolvens]SFK12267.1 monosaccharide ABC transporter membrane protein, CUT2 family [Succinivibrio dextrinosolvens]